MVAIEATVGFKEEGGGELGFIEWREMGPIKLYASTRSKIL